MPDVESIAAAAVQRVFLRGPRPRHLPAHGGRLMRSGPWAIEVWYAYDRDRGRDVPDRAAVVAWPRGATRAEARRKVAAMLAQLMGDED